MAIPIKEWDFDELGSLVVDPVKEEIEEHLKKVAKLLGENTSFCYLEVYGRHLQIEEEHIHIFEVSFCLRK